jgi:hypothetical protein
MPGEAHIVHWWTDAEADHAARRELAGFLVRDLKGERSVMYEVNVRSVPERSMLCVLRHLRWDEFAAVRWSSAGPSRLRTRRRSPSGSLIWCAPVLVGPVGSGPGSGSGGGLECDFAIPLTSGEAANPTVGEGLPEVEVGSGFAAGDGADLYGGRLHAILSRTTSTRKKSGRRCRI